MVHVHHSRRGRRCRVSITVVLGEDNVLVREGVRALLDSYDDIEVVGVAEDAPTLLAAAAEHVPDVVVTDIKMPPSFQLEGIDCAHAIREQHPDTGVVVLSAARRRGVRDRPARPGTQRPRLPLEGSHRPGRRARPGDPRGARGRQHGRPDDRRAALGPRGRRRARPRAARHDGEGPRLRGDRRRARHDAGSGRPAGDRAVPRHGRRRRSRPASSTSSSGCMRRSSSRPRRATRSPASCRSSSPIGWPHTPMPRSSRRRSRSPSCSATSGASRRSPSGWRPARWPRSSDGTCPRWPRS